MLVAWFGMATKKKCLFGYCCRFCGRRKVKAAVAAVEKRLRKINIPFHRRRRCRRCLRHNCENRFGFVWQYFGEYSAPHRSVTDRKRSFIDRSICSTKNPRNKESIGNIWWSRLNLNVLPQYYYWLTVSMAGNQWKLYLPHSPSLLFDCPIVNNSCLSV